MFVFYSNFCKVCEEIEVHIAPSPYGIRRRKRRNQSESLNMHISQWAIANVIKFAVWPTLPGGQL